MRKFLCAFVVISLSSQHAHAEPRFSKVEAPDHQYLGEWEHYVGGGLSTFDCNGDNFPEIFAAGGSAPSILLQNTTPAIGAPPSFQNATPKNLSLTGVTGAYPIDIDSDGITDLAVLRVGENVLLKGSGDCTFSEFKDLNFSSTDQWTTAFSATWEAGNTLPTMAFGNYVNRNDPDGPFEACDTNTLYRPESGAYLEPTKLAPSYCTLSLLFSDWARNGQQDLRVSNDRHYYVRDGAEQMWDMSQKPRLYTEKDGWKSYKLWGMGIASRDLTGDGFPEVYLTSMGDQKMQSPLGNGTPQFDDYTYERGTTAHRPYTGGDGRPSTGWHVAFGDIENNGRDDMFIAKGNVERMAGAAMDDPNNLLIQDENGNFTEEGEIAGIASLVRSRGASLVDFNGDGLLDLAVNNRRADMEIYQNISSQKGNWVALEIKQTDTNTDGIGAIIELKADGNLHTREITIGGGHAGGNLGPHHFGLGKASKATARVIWPDGTSTEWREMDANQVVLVERFK